LLFRFAILERIADLDDMTSDFAEISADGGRYFGHPDTAASQGYLVPVQKLPE
jgi:hypothetical protein